MAADDKNLRRLPWSRDRGRGGECAAGQLAIEDTDVRVLVGGDLDRLGRGCTLGDDKHARADERAPETGA